MEVNSPSNYVLTLQSLKVAEGLCPKLLRLQNQLEARPR